MPVLQTDDSVRRLRALWLGPPGLRWPFDATYIEWCLGAVLSVASAFVLWIVTTVVFGFPYNYLMTFTGAPAIGGLLAWLIRPHIEPNKPVNYWRRGIKVEFSNKSTQTGSYVRLSFPKVFREIDSQSEVE